MKFPFSPEGTRPTPVWALVLLLFAFWVLAQFATAPFLLLAYIGGGKPSPDMMMWVILLALLAGSLALVAGPLWWIQTREFRDPGGIGIRLDKHGWRQYRWGWGVGALYWLALLLLGALLGHLLGVGGTDGKDVQLHWSNLADPFLILMLAGLLVLFAIQGAAEEVLCRGWLLTNLTAWHGALPAVVGSSILFACLHPQYFFIDGDHISVHQVLTGLTGLFAIFTMGLMLGLLALRDRSVMGAAGLHGAFNFMLIGGTLVVGKLTGNDSVQTQFLHAVHESTSLQNVQPALVVQILLSLFVAWVLFRAVQRHRHPGSG